MVDNAAENEKALHSSGSRMPPSACLHSNSLLAIDEEIPDLGMLGSVEVGEDGGILFDPSSDSRDDDMDYEMGRYSHSVAEDESMDDGDEGVEAPPEYACLWDSLLMYGCIGCDPCVATCVNPQKEGILKKGGSRIPVHGEHSLNSRSVSFSLLDIKTFPMTLGNNPCATSGPPVMLDWESKPTFERVVSLDEYERSRSPRRTRKMLKLSYRDRKGILEGQQGFTAEEVNQAWAEAIKIRQQRNETLRRSSLMHTWDDVWESAQRKCHRVAEAVGMA